MKEELQQIQAVAVVTFLCALIAIHSSGEYGEWFEISGTRQDIFDPANPENGTAYYSFEYSYHTDHYTYFDTDSGETERKNYDSTNCSSCVEKAEMKERPYL